MNLLDFFRNCLNVGSAKKLKDDFFCHRETILFREFCMIGCMVCCLKREELYSKCLERDLIRKGLVDWIMTGKIQLRRLLRIGLSQAFSKK
jgi:hypothetical protein